MIELKKLNGTAIFVNPDMIRAVESTPDTLVQFIDGESLLVQTSPQEIVAKIVSFRKMYSTAHIGFATDEQQRGLAK